MSYTVSLRSLLTDSSVVVVGCGGTGGFVAEGLCRILPEDEKILLVDHDRVEPHNLRRQNFYDGDVGKFKSQVLAERLSRQFRRRIGYTVYPYDLDIMSESWGPHMYTRAVQGLIIGCVDNTATRRQIADYIPISSWWLDAGNGYNSGQVLLGNTMDVGQLQNTFDEVTQKVYALPAPALQLPSLLIPPNRPTREADCAEAIAADEQSPVINQAMASLVLNVVHLLMKDQLTWMGAYIDLELGTLQTVPADPVTVARMCGVKVETLLAKGCSIGYRYRLR